VKIRQVALVSLFQELGFANAESWEVSKLQSRAQKIQSLLDDETGPKTAKGRKLCEELVKAVEAEEEIEVMTSAASTKTAPAKGSKKGSKKAPKAAAKPSSNGPRKVGVIDTIIECLKKGSAKSPVTKEDILKALVKKFPDRRPEAMKNTVSAQVPTHLRIEKNITVKSNDNGYWL